MNNQENMTPPKETNETPMTETKRMKNYVLSKEEFRIIFLKKFSEIQENTNEQLKEITKDCINKTRNLTKE